MTLKVLKSQQYILLIRCTLHPSESFIISTLLRFGRPHNGSGTPYCTSNRNNMDHHDFYPMCTTSIGCVAQKLKTHFLTSQKDIVKRRESAKGKTAINMPEGPRHGSIRIPPGKKVKRWPQRLRHLRFAIQYTMSRYSRLLQKLTPICLPHEESKCPCPQILTPNGAPLAKQTKTRAFHLSTGAYSTSQRNKMRMPPPFYQRTIGGYPRMYFE